MSAPTWASRCPGATDLGAMRSTVRSNGCRSISTPRSKGKQKMTVQHVNVGDGGQAIIGNVNAPAEGGGAREKTGDHLDMYRALRCHAKSKRSGLPCRAEVCRMHGAGGGARKGNKNAVKHGAMVAESIALRREVQALARMARKTIAAIG